MTYVERVRQLDEPEYYQAELSNQHYIEFRLTTDQDGHTALMIVDHSLCVDELEFVEIANFAHQPCAQVIRLTIIDYCNQCIPDEVLGLA